MAEVGVAKAKRVAKLQNLTTTKPPWNVSVSKENKRKWRRMRGDDENRNGKPRKIAVVRRKDAPEKKKAGRCNSNSNRSNKMKEKMEEAEEGS